MTQSSDDNYDTRLATQFGQAVAARRLEARITSEMLARKAGLGRIHVSRIENGRVKVSLEVAARIAKALKVEIGTCCRNTAVSAQELTVRTLADSVGAFKPHRSQDVKP